MQIDSWQKTRAMVAIGGPPLYHTPGVLSILFSKKIKKNCAKNFRTILRKRGQWLDNDALGRNWTYNISVKSRLPYHLATRAEFSLFIAVRCFDFRLLAYLTLGVAIFPFGKITFSKITLKPITSARQRKMLSVFQRLMNSTLVFGISAKVNFFMFLSSFFWWAVLG